MPPTIFIYAGEDKQNLKEKEGLALYDRDNLEWITLPTKVPIDCKSVVGCLRDELYTIYGTHDQLRSLNKDLKYVNLDSQMIDRRNCSSYVEYKHTLYAFGGNSEDNEVLNTAEAYEPQSSGRWNKITKKMKHGRKNAAAAVLRDKIFVCGGIGVKGRPLKSVECFDPKKEIWSEMMEMPIPFIRLAAVSYCRTNEDSEKETLVVLGEYLKPDEEKNLLAVFELDPFEEDPKWQELPSLETFGGFFYTAAVLDEEIFAFHGTSDKPGYVDLHIFNGTSWEVGSSPPFECNSLSAITIPQNACVLRKSRKGDCVIIKENGDPVNPEEDCGDSSVANNLINLFCALLVRKQMQRSENYDHQENYE